MEWINNLNMAIDYIEDNITEEINYEELAKIACCSTYHFQRMFGYMAGVSLAEYIRRRRMSLAAVDLLNSDEKIIEIGLKYGYTSPTAFNRAFQNIHGISPTKARKHGTSIKSYPPISFKMTIKGVEEMNYRIEEKAEFRIVGISEKLHKNIEKNFKIVPKMWEEASINGTIPTLVSLMNEEPSGMLGVSACNNDQEWRYFIAVSSSKPIENNFEEYIVPSFTWAIFPGSGTGQSIQKLEERIITEWFPTSGYEYANGPDIEVYINPDPNNAKYEVWIPVIKKQ
ncbi:AraC family transcriptional regulator [Miniphocaeibacter halophilus]|uniref:AraC family transcriptional regulator n=1 Tax=Miniphocaeibacter halophilus TaxID=2931922 RepID=A0AC61MTZ1_9FIRM|nr:AraC family transcriptional regulator [Miniphocaeibacter halophilus]QQK08863.1 AraC family transcriptional regulator [Miniphocaeibacter halophilus]